MLICLLFPVKLCRYVKKPRLQFQTDQIMLLACTGTHAPFFGNRIFSEYLPFVFSFPLVYF